MFVCYTALNIVKKYLLEGGVICIDLGSSYKPIATLTSHTTYGLVGYINQLSRVYQRFYKPASCKSLGRHDCLSHHNVHDTRERNGMTDLPSQRLVIQIILAFFLISLQKHPSLASLSVVTTFDEAGFWCTRPFQHHLKQRNARLEDLI